MMYFPENFKKPVVQNFYSVILLISVAIANGHSIPVERAVNNFLALPAVQGAGPDMVCQFICG
jgi:hypothetical protein